MNLRSCSTKLITYFSENELKSVRMSSLYNPYKFISFISRYNLCVDEACRYIFIEHSLDYIFNLKFVTYWLHTSSICIVNVTWIKFYSTPGGKYLVIRWFTSNAVTKVWLTYSSFQINILIYIPTRCLHLYIQGHVLVSVVDMLRWWDVDKQAHTLY